MDEEFSRRLSVESLVLLANHPDEAASARAVQMIPLGIRRVPGVERFPEDHAVSIGEKHLGGRACVATIAKLTGPLMDQSDIAHAGTDIGTLPRTPTGFVVGGCAQLPCDGCRVFHSSPGPPGFGEEVLERECGFTHDLRNDTVLRETCLQPHAEMGGVLVGFGLFLLVAQLCRPDFEIVCTRGGSLDRALSMRASLSGRMPASLTSMLHIGP